MDKILTEKDLEFLFSKKAKGGKQKRMKRGVLYFIAPVVLVAALYFALNYKSLGQIFSYWLSNDYSSSDQPTPSSGLSINTDANADKSTDQFPMPENLPQINNNTINIPTINITAPVTFGVQNESGKISEALSQGVAQILYTSLPGETGNVFITGHSSNYPWAKGNYNSIFALLNKLVIGDLIQIKYNDQVYAYKVSDVKVVNPDNVSVMYPTSDSIISLMTCTPVGTNLRRLIVTGKQIYPDPSLNRQSQYAPQTDVKKLPKAQ